LTGKLEPDRLSVRNKTDDVLVSSIATWNIQLRNQLSKLIRLIIWHFN
jgi:hypothetical protein